ncbi:MAG: aminotransferase class IV [Bacteroidetes bacterium]|nr:aminotransferase class IV [Bacteroidota bacterium]
MKQKFNPKNENIKIFVGNKLYERNEARVSVYDSSVQGGDAVWEGLRVYDGKIFQLQMHLNRLKASAHALMFENIPSEEFIRQAINDTLVANQMHSDTHIRLTLTRGEKITSGMDPRLNQKGCTLIVLAEWKSPVYDNQTGVSLFTSSIRRNNPNFLDSKIHHNNLLNNVLAKIQANLAGADDGLMLDHHGFVAETNACNIFMLSEGKLFTPTADSCLHGITRKTILDICKKTGIEVVEKNISLVEFYNADFAFTTGTMGELTPVNKIDGRIISQKAQALFDTLLNEFKNLTFTASEKIY